MRRTVTAGGQTPALPGRRSRPSVRDEPLCERAERPRDPGEPLLDAVPVRERLPSPVLEFRQESRGPRGENAGGPLPDDRGEDRVRAVREDDVSAAERDLTE